MVDHFEAVVVVVVAAAVVVESGTFEHVDEWHPSLEAYHWRSLKQESVAKDDTLACQIDTTLEMRPGAEDKISGVSETTNFRLGLNSSL